MRPSVYVSALLVFQACASGDAQIVPVMGDVTVAAEETVYRIAGRSEDQLLDQMMMLGPTVSGQRFFAYTSWRVRLSAERDTATAECEIIRWHVFLDVTTTLPEWQPSSDVASSLSEMWDSFLNSLRDHEEGHKRLAVDGAKKVLRVLQQMSRKPCDEAEAAARRATASIFGRARARSSGYDRATEHGASMGAIWPWR
ncbi:MAG: DUF922 domain-containing protein [Gemmatimonadales bacterium]